MKPASQSTSTQLTSSQPEITRDEYKGLPRVERIYNALMYPRNFQMSSSDEDRLELMKAAFSIMLSCPTELRARQAIRAIKPSVTMSTSDVLELMRETKDFFGKIEIRDDVFDRMVLRHRFQENANQSRLAGDYKEERLALRNLMELDALAIKEAISQGPVVPPLPDIKFSVFKPISQISDAIIESQPIEDGSEEE